MNSHTHVLSIPENLNETIKDHIHLTDNSKSDANSHSHTVEVKGIYERK